jgi:hypothetical protein
LTRIVTALVAIWAVLAVVIVGVVTSSLALSLVGAVQ